MFTDLSGANDGPFLWGDFDNDGDLDLLGPYPNIFRNDGGGHFSEVRAAFATLQGAKGDWGDFDNDGDLDIAGITFDPNDPNPYSGFLRNDGGRVCGFRSPVSRSVPIMGRL